MIEVDGDGAALTGRSVYEAAAAKLNLTRGRFKLMIRGSPLPGGGGESKDAAAAAAATVSLVDGGEQPVAGEGGCNDSRGEWRQRQRRRQHIHNNNAPPPPHTHEHTDTLVVVPQRRAPTDATVAAAAEALGASPADEDDDDGPLRFALPRDAPRWHRSLAGFLRHKCGAPDLALAALFALGPGRLLVLLAACAGARVAHAFGLGPIYLMLAVVAAIFCNLGERREGEASAYSIFNEGVRRLPGQLDAEQLDDQIRRGAGVPG